MSPLKFPLALLAFLMFVGVMPAWSYFIGQYAPNLSIEAQFMATLVPPATALLFLGSWLQPRGGGA